MEPRITGIRFPSHYVGIDAEQKCIRFEQNLGTYGIEWVEVYDKNDKLVAKYNLLHAEAVHFGGDEW